MEKRREISEIFFEVLLLESAAKFLDGLVERSARSTGFSLDLGRCSLHQAAAKATQLGREACQNGPNIVSEIDAFVCRAVGTACSQTGRILVKHVPAFCRVLAFLGFERVVQ